MTLSPSAAARRAIALPCLLLLLAGCATTGARSPQDPAEPMNRDVYKFNDALDRAVLKPTARAYHEHLPDWVQTGVSNFFSNLAYPGTIVNQLLQGKLLAAGQDTARFAMNLTLGLGGLLDPATDAHLPRHDEDLGQTLGRWGVPPGPYLMLPLLGPSSVRDAPSVVFDRFLEPFYWYNYGNERWVSLGLGIVDRRARLLPLDPTIERAYDPYAFIREAYLQRRRFQVYDGNPPDEPLRDPLEDFGDDAAAPPPEQPPGGAQPD
jgi:phospholipid-binding lipoprotein MlaA